MLTVSGARIARHRSHPDRVRYAARKPQLARRRARKTPLWQTRPLVTEERHPLATVGNLCARVLTERAARAASERRA